MNTSFSFLWRSFPGLLASLVIAVGALTSIVATAPPASGLTQLTVTDNSDAGVGSLRQLFAVANSIDDDVQIIIPASVGDITLTTGPLVYDGGIGGNHTLTLTGEGNTITQTTPDARVINDTAMTLFAMSGLTITGGDAGDEAGGGILVQGSATIVDATITGNEAGDAAAGIRVSNGPLTLIDSTISGNTAGGSAGGVYVNGDATIVNSTITGNVATNGSGGGVFIGVGNDLQLVYSTVVGNTADNVGANVFMQGDGDMEAFGTLVASPLGNGLNCAFGDNVTRSSGGYNWDDDGSCGFDQPTDHSDAGDPELGPLAENGGPTPTMLPAETSGLVGDIPAVACDDGDALAGFAVTTDQRGEPRPDPTTGACDIGAVELQFEPPPPPSPPTPASPVFLEPTFTG